ncbi:outer membrane beta-barrel protein [Cesiribacter andamanensis]|nr:outer membrane beta-barrel protein [Cesiribacter andamanensis]
MKKVLFAALVACMGLSSSAYAQFQQGTIAVGGGVSMASERSKVESGNTTEKDDPINSFSLTPGIGYFIASDLEVGLRFGLGRASQKGDDEKWVYSAFSAGPYVRKYFSLGESIALFGEGGLSFGSGKIKETAGNTSREYGKSSTFALGITPGFMFKPSERIGIDLTAGYFGYRSTKSETYNNWTENEITETDSEFGLSLDLSSVQLGVRLFF